LRKKARGTSRVIPGNKYLCRISEGFREGSFSREKRFGKKEDTPEKKAGKDPDQGKVINIWDAE